MAVCILAGDCRAMLATLPADSVHCVVTSPPYWNLRDYGIAGQLGLEATPAEYVAAMIAVFREVRRVLRPDGCIFLNLGDCYRGKQLIGIPWRLAFALQADGWYLRAEVIWHKPNPMPESVTDRPTRAHEQVFLLTRSRRYFWDQAAVREEAAELRPMVSWAERKASGEPMRRGDPASSGHITRTATLASAAGRNPRSVWTIPTAPFAEAHFATFPPKLVEPCIKAGCPQGGTVLDPFAGAGTVGLVAARLQRDAILIELNPEYVAMAERRIAGDLLPGSDSVVEWVRRPGSDFAVVEWVD